MIPNSKHYQVPTNLPTLSRLAAHFLYRELHGRFASSLLGYAWALVQPLVQLAIYGFVFAYVFKARIPGAGAPEFVAFLAVALWPWTALSEAVLRSTTVINDNSALIGKIAIPRELLVVANTAAAFLVHGIGFFAILIVLTIAEQGISWTGFVLAIPLFAMLYVLGLGIALMCAAIQVFVRDLSSILGQVLPLLMFTAPVFYDRGLLPKSVQPWMDLNPFTFYAEAFRATLLRYGEVSAQSWIIAAVIAVGVLLAGRWLFARLDPHFEDFL